MIVENYNEEDLRHRFTRKELEVIVEAHHDLDARAALFDSKEYRGLIWNSLDIDFCKLAEQVLANDKVAAKV